jgi:hypothetical protein
MLRVVRQHSEFVGDSVRVLCLLLLQHGIKFFSRAATNKLRVLHSISEKLVRGLNIAFNNFLKVFKELFSAYLKL